MTSRSVSKLALAVLAASSLALPAFSQAVDRALSHRGHLGDQRHKQGDLHHPHVHPRQAGR
jgi:Ni/Co efflux regulator RcnB